MINIAIMGYGTIGSGVYRIITENADVLKRNCKEEITVKRVLDLRDFPDSPIEDILTKDFNDILNDPDISVVVETMGGVEPAYTFESRLLAAGKHVVTSNKALVEAKGPELFKTASDNHVNFFFEASVGGGIPIIRALTGSLTADKIDKIEGILNGTTNFMLNAMSRQGKNYSDILKTAQELGYAEQDPTADVEGYDAGRKIAILASMVLGKRVSFEALSIEGITGLKPEDFSYARELGMEIKLVAGAFFEGDAVRASVAPCMVRPENPLHNVNDVFNAVTVHGNMIDTVMFYGRGAGSSATASAVVSDVVMAIIRKDETVYGGWISQPARLLDPEKEECAFFVRINGKEEDEPEIAKAFGGGSAINVHIKNEIGFVTPVMTYEKFEQCAAGVPGFIKRIRIK